jgi:hypothetical protein
MRALFAHILFFICTRRRSPATGNDVQWEFLESRGAERDADFSYDYY